MPDKKKPIEDDVEGHRHTAHGVTEDDVEGHRHTARGVTEDDVEGHRHTARGVTEDDVEGHSVARAVEGGDDDVEGHNIGVMNPIVARDLIRARERDIQREASRNSLISEAKRALGRKR